MLRTRHERTPIGSRGRVALWSEDPTFRSDVAAGLARRDLEATRWSHLFLTGPHVHLVILDVDTLPRIWLSAVGAMRRHHPSVALLLVSADARHCARLHAWRPCGFVQKPFGADDLARVVEALLHDLRRYELPSLHTETRAPAGPAAAWQRVQARLG
jgi:hypothetical protein